MTDRSLLKGASLGMGRRFWFCSEPASPRSSGQVSNATQGTIARRAPSGHLIAGRRNGIEALRTDDAPDEAGVLELLQEAVVIEVFRRGSFRFGVVRRQLVQDALEGRVGEERRLLQIFRGEEPPRLLDLRLVLPLGAV